MKRLLAVLLALAVVGSLSAQTISLDPAKLDFSKAKLSVAGPSDIYVRSIWYGNVELSVLLKYDGANGVFVYGPYLAAQKLIQQDGAKFMVGPLVDAFKNTIQPLCAEAGVMLATSDTCNGSAAITYDGNTDVSPEKKLYIRAHWANDEAMPYLIDYLKENYPNAKKVAVCGSGPRRSRWTAPGATPRARRCPSRRRPTRTSRTCTGSCRS